jgi:predicted GIY-YIG superfamily endonuclease
MIYIYILELEDGYYYIGRTSDVKKRYKYHKAGYGSTWTKLHKPIRLLEIVEDASPYDEDRYVKEYMAKYGIDKVRGGTYVKIHLDKLQKYLLEKEIWNAQDSCVRCGRNGHFVTNCYEKYNINNEQIIYQNDNQTDLEELPTIDDIYSGCLIM